MIYTGLELKDLTPKQLEFFLTYIFNGVGSREFFINPRDFIFKNAAKTHDLKYFCGGNDTLRKIADKNFFEECCKAVLRQPGYKRVFYFPIAYVYYSALILLGKYAWEYYDTPAGTWPEFIQHAKNSYIRKKKAIPEYLNNAENII